MSRRNSCWRINNHVTLLRKTADDSLDMSNLLCNCVKNEAQSKMFQGKMKQKLFQTIGTAAPSQAQLKSTMYPVPKYLPWKGLFFTCVCLSQCLMQAVSSICSYLHARLKPIIEGGTYRVWSRTQDLQLSAEQSYDPNMDPDSQSLLHYHWECQSTSKVRGGGGILFS